MYFYVTLAATSVSTANHTSVTPHKVQSHSTMDLGAREIIDIVFRVLSVVLRLLEIALDAYRCLKARQSPVSHA